jgi:hypothetical protein
MDITPETKSLIATVQALKSRYTDPASLLFLDFYCQCKQGCDYLFPLGVRESIRLIDILNWFLECIEKNEPIPLVRLMWKDVAGPTLEEYMADERIEKQLTASFKSDMHPALTTWDRITLSNGGVRLILRELLDDIHKLELAQLALKA